MLTFIKANIASLFASLMDYLLTVSLVYFLRVDPVAASISGTVFGGIIHFFVGRGWVFRVAGNKISKQAVRYVLVWTGNLLLNTAGVYLAVKVAGIDIAVSKLMVSLFVSLAYNYPLQKRYVFYNN